MNQFDIVNNCIIEIDDWDVFLKYAKEAPLFLYEPQLFSSPFINDEKIRCVNCYAIGIKLRDYPLILKYQKIWDKSDFQGNSNLNSPKDMINSVMQTFIENIKKQFHAIKGTIHAEKSNINWSDYFLK